jgi:hypothetical protein
MLSPHISSLKTPSWLNEFRAFIMRGVVNGINTLAAVFPLTNTHKNAKSHVRPE